MIPTLVDENGQVKLVVGASGGPRIITGITYVRLWINDKGPSIQDVGIFQG